jgi:ubiquinone/menaquinone biosynthesis C-methylase UbiE
MAEFREPNFKERFFYRIFVWYFRKKMYIPFVEKLDLKGDEKVLEFGSGMGVAARLVADILKDGGGVITCMDISEKWMKMLKKYTKNYSNVKTILSEMKEEILPKDHFDVIYFDFVLHDIPQNERQFILKELKSALRQKGKFLLREPYDESHGIPIKEIEKYMKEMEMKNLWSEKTKIFRLNCYNAEYSKH